MARSSRLILRLPVAMVRPWMTAPSRPNASPATSIFGAVRHDWTRAEVRALFALPFPELMFRAQSIHRRNFDPTEVQISTLLSIKTGGCPEDCAYCPQSAHYDTGVKAEKLMSARRGAGRGARRQERRREPLLHGRGLARAEGPRPRQGLRDGRRREGARARDLRHARHAHRRRRRSGSRPPASTTTTTTSTPRRNSTATIITTRTYQDRLDTLGARARRRHPRLLRRHRRHGRGRRGPRRHDRDARQPAGASGKRADQHAGARSRARRWRAAPSSIRSTSCAPSRSRASSCRSRWCGSRPGART